MVDENLQGLLEQASETGAYTLPFSHRCAHCADVGRHSGSAPIPCLLRLAFGVYPLPAPMFRCCAQQKGPRRFRPAPLFASSVRITIFDYA